MAGDMRLEYAVDADTRGMLSLTNSASRAERGVVRSFGRMDDAASKLSATFTAITSALATNKIISYADAWVTVNNKLANSVRAHEELAEVTDRVFNIAQGSMAPLDATAALYQKLERSMRGTVYTMQDVATVTETINKALSVSGATASETESVITQLGQALGSGALMGQEFNSLAENGTRVLAALSDALGVNIGKLKEMAGARELTTGTVFAALLAQSGKIDSEFSKMTRTMGKAFLDAENNITRFVGESVTVQKVVGEIGNGVISLSNNLDTVAQIAAYAGLAFGSKLVGGLALSTQAALTNAIASAKLAQANSASAAMALRRAVAEKQSALALVSTAKMEELATRGKVGHAFALENLTRVQGLAFAATGKYNVSLAANATAQTAASATARTMTVATTGLKTAMTFLGGPVGVIMLAVSALYLFKSANNDAEAATDRLSTSIKGLGIAQSKLLQINLGKDIAETEGRIKALNQRLKFANDETVSLTSARRELVKVEIAAELEKENKTLDDQNSKLKESAEFIKNKGRTWAEAFGGTSTISPEVDSGKVSKSLSKVIDQLATEREAIQTEYEKRNAVILAETEKGSTQQNDLLRRNSADRATLLADLAESEAKVSIKAGKEYQAEMLKLNKQIEEQATERMNLATQQQATGISANPMLNETVRYEKELDALKLSEQLKLTTKQEYMALEAGMIATHEENKRAIMEETFRGMSAQNEMLMSTFDTLQNAATNVFSGMLSGTMSATDAMKSFGNAVLNEAIGSLVQLGIEQVKQAVMGKALQASTTATTLAQAAILAAAWKPAAISASIATSGGASVAGYSSFLANNPFSVAGGRLYGGATQAGKAYRVNENGRPEMYTDERSGQSYMMGGGRGTVTPAGEVGGGKSININQSFVFEGGTPQDQQTMQQFAQMSKAQTIQIIQQEMRQGGMLAR